MDKDERAGIVLADMATILANTAAITALAHLLVVKGTITETEFERVRHFHLDQFDQLFSRELLPPTQAELLEQRRAKIDEFWSA